VVDLHLHVADYPNEFILPNRLSFNNYYYVLFVLEFGCFRRCWAVWRWWRKGPWRKIYWQPFFRRGVVLAFLPMAETRRWGASSTTAGAFTMFRTMRRSAGYLDCVEREECAVGALAGGERERWADMPDFFAVLAVLSLPVIGLSELFLDPQASQLRVYRVVVTLIGILLLGVCVFLRQILLAREMTRLLLVSKQNLEHLQRAQTS